MAKLKKGHFDWKETLTLTDGRVFKVEKVTRKVWIESGTNGWREGKIEVDQDTYYALDDNGKRIGLVNACGRDATNAELRSSTHIK